MLSMDIFDNDDSEESFFSFLVLLMQHGSAAPAFALEVIRLGAALRARGTGRPAHAPSGAALLSHGRCQAAQLNCANSCLPPSLLSHLQSGLLQLPDLKLPVCKEQCMELGLRSCQVAFQGKVERKATADRSWAGQ